MRLADACPAKLQWVSEDHACLDVFQTVWQPFRESRRARRCRRLSMPNMALALFSWSQPVDSCKLVRPHAKHTPSGNWQYAANLDGPDARRDAPQ